jgi:hypothetical protein
MCLRVSFHKKNYFNQKCLIDLSSNFSCVGEGTQETGYRPVTAPAQQDDVRGSLRGARLRHHWQVAPFSSFNSVADPDPGFGMGKKSGSGSEQPGSCFREIRSNFLG